eukprot:5888067-Ditylum_brightwellii.AAC.1
MQKDGPFGMRSVKRQFMCLLVCKEDLLLEKEIYYVGANNSSANVVYVLVVTFHAQDDDILPWDREVVKEKCKVSKNNILASLTTPHI